MIWKTPWNRARGTPDVDPSGNMPFFNTFDDGDGNRWEYRSAAVSTLGAALPFWYGLVGIGIGGNFGAGGFGGGGWNAAVSGNLTQVTYTAAVNPTFTLADITDSMTVPDISFVEAVIVVVTVLDGGYRVRAYFQNQQYLVFDSVAAYVPGAPTLQFQLPFQGALHGAAGGAFDLTSDEMSQWFLDLKSNLAIQAIPGKTSHLYSASSVFPLVPAVLPNGAGVQTLDLTAVGAPVSVPANTMVPVKFNY